MGRQPLAALITAVVIVLAGLVSSVSSNTELTQCTTPNENPISKDPSFVITLPWGPGLTHHVMAEGGYGMGDHINDCNHYFAKDYYALDFDLKLNESVRAVAPGTVQFAGRTTGGWDAYGQAVYIDHGNGYRSFYAHLNSVDVSVGQPVTQGQHIGKAGSTSDRDIPVHLHFALYHESSIAGGPYGGKAVLPEPFVGAQQYTGIHPGMELISAGSPILNFTARLQGRASNHNARVTIEVRNPGNNRAIFSETVQTDSNGQYNGLSLTGVPPGNYDIFAKTRASLRGAILNRTLYSGSNTLDFGTLPVGDLNGDNIVNSIDNEILFIGWRNTWNNPQPCPDNPENCHKADFNLDSKVNSIDDAILKNNWGNRGEGGIGFTAASVTHVNLNLSSEQNFGPATLSLERFGADPIEVGNTFDLELNLSSGGRDVSGVDVIVRYDPCVLQVIDTNSSEPGIQIETGPIFPSYPFNTVDTTTGEIHIAGIAALNEPFNGTHELFATIRFLVFANTKSGQTHIWVDHNEFTVSTVDSNATEYGVAQDILGMVFNRTIPLSGSPQRSDPSGAITDPVQGGYVNRTLIPISVSASDSCGQVEYVTIQKLGTNESNLAPNPALERGSVLPDGWVPEIPGVPFAPNAEMIWDDTTAHSGTHSVRIFNVGTDGVKLGMWSTADWIPIDPSKEYALTVWIKSTKEIDNFISFGLLTNSEGGCGISSSRSVLEVSGDWTHYVWEPNFDPDSVGCPPFDAVKIELWFGNPTSELDTNSVWFDDVYFGPPDALEWQSLGVDSDGSDGWTIIWDATSHFDSTLSLRAEISLDPVRFNRSTTASVSGIILDRTTPHLDSFSFTPPSPSTANVVRISASATDNLSGVDHAEVYVNTATDGSTSGAWNYIGTINGASGFVDWDTTEYDAGVHRVAFDVRDRAGNWELWTSGSQPTITYEICLLRTWDMNKDGVVDLNDIIPVADRWRTSAANPDPDGDPSTPDYEAQYDVDGDGEIDTTDIMSVVAAWGTTCP